MLITNKKALRKKKFLTKIFFLGGHHAVGVGFAEKQFLNHLVQLGLTAQDFAIIDRFWHEKLPDLGFQHGHKCHFVEHDDGFLYHIPLGRTCFRTRA